MKASETIERMRKRLEEVGVIKFRPKLRLVVNNKAVAPKYPPGCRRIESMDWLN